MIIVPATEIKTVTVVDLKKIFAAFQKSRRIKLESKKLILGATAAMGVVAASCFAMAIYRYFAGQYVVPICFFYIYLFLYVIKAVRFFIRF